MFTKKHVLVGGLSKVQTFCRSKFYEYLSYTCLVLTFWAKFLSVLSKDLFATLPSASYEVASPQLIPVYWETRWGIEVLTICLCVRVAPAQVHTLSLSLTKSTQRYWARGLTELVLREKFNKIVSDGWVSTENYVFYFIFSFFPADMSIYSLFVKRESKKRKTSSQKLGRYARFEKVWAG